jgi:hypothetical protein
MSSSKSTQNVREFPRLPKEVSVEIGELSYPLSAAAREVAVSKDISPKGVCFICAADYKPGAVLTVKINLLGWQRHKKNLAVVLDDRELGRPLSVLAEVVWCRPGAENANEVGVKFINIPDDDYKALEKMLSFSALHF